MLGLCKNFASHTLIRVPGTLIRVWEAKFRVWEAKFRVWGAKFRVWGAKFTVWEAKFRVREAKFRVWEANYATPLEKLCLSDSGLWALSRSRRNRSLLGEAKPCGERGSRAGGDVSPDLKRVQP